VTDYGLFAIGGEVPFMIYDAAQERVRVLSGIGRAPLSTEAIEWYYANGIPDEGSYLAMPVPGALHLCITALELFGTRSFAQAVAPTLELLDAGSEGWHPPLAVTLRKMVQAEMRAAGSRERKLHAARDRFHTGDIADDLVAWYQSKGSFLGKDDLAAHETTVEDPVSIRYRGYEVCKCNTWTQGPVLCQTLRLLEGRGLSDLGHLSADYIHTVTEAMKLAYADRDTYYADPDFADVPLRQLLSDEYTALRAELITRTASMERRPGDPIRMRAILGEGDARDNPVRTRRTAMLRSPARATSCPSRKYRKPRALSA